MMPKVTFFCLFVFNPSALGLSVICTNYFECLEHVLNLLYIFRSQVRILVSRFYNSSKNNVFLIS